MHKLRPHLGNLSNASTSIPVLRCLAVFGLLGVNLLSCGNDDRADERASAEQPASDDPNPVEPVGDGDDTNAGDGRKGEEAGVGYDEGAPENSTEPDIDQQAPTVPTDSQHPAEQQPVVGIGSEPDVNVANPDVIDNNGQTGSIGASECGTDDDCRVQESWYDQPAGELELLSARCDYIDPSLDLLPVCHCTMRYTPTLSATATFEEGSGTEEPRDIVMYPGHRGFPQRDGCSVFGRTPECSYCASEFPGCNIDDSTSCDATCDELLAIEQAEYAISYEIETRHAQCTDTGNCELILELNGQCYVGQPRADERGFDCSLSDEELLEHRGEFQPGTCESPPSVSCETALDCPAGLACNAGVCGRCADQCSYPNGEPENAVCDGDASCAEGELCAMGVCVLEENIACRFSNQCGDGGNCALSGLDFSAGRGNQNTRAYCVDYTPCPEPVRDENGNLMMAPAMDCY